LGKATHVQQTNLLIFDPLSPITKIAKLTPQSITTTAVH